MNYFKSLPGVMMLLAMTHSQAATVDMQPGMWEWIMTMEMQGVPMAIPPTTYSDCLSKDDLVPRQPQQGNQCKLVESDVSGDSVSWKIECPTPNGASISEGRMTYKGTTATGEMNAITQGMTMKSTLNGRRTGACK